MPVTPINPYDLSDKHMIWAYVNGVAHCSCGLCWRTAYVPSLICPRVVLPDYRSEANNQISTIEINGHPVWQNPRHTPQPLPGRQHGCSILRGTGDFLRYIFGR